MLGFDVLSVRYLLANRLEWESRRSGHHGVLSGEACCRQMARFRGHCSFTKGVDVFPFVWWSFLLVEDLLCENKQEWHRLSKRMFSHTSSSYLSPLCNRDTALFGRTLGHDFFQRIWDRKSNGLDGSAGSDFSGGWEGSAIPLSRLAEGLPQQLKKLT